MLWMSPVMLWSFYMYNWYLLIFWFSQVVLRKSQTFPDDKQWGWWPKAGKDVVLLRPSATGSKQGHPAVLREFCEATNQSWSPDAKHVIQCIELSLVWRL